MIPTLRGGSGRNHKRPKKPTDTTVISPPVNVAASANGGVVTASSEYSDAQNGTFPAVSLNNGDRKGLNWGSTGGWAATPADAATAYVEVTFSTSQTIDKVNVFTIQDNYTSPSEPTPSMTFSTYGVTGCDVKYWNGSSFVTVGSVTGSNLVWKTFTFSPVTTTKIRVYITSFLVLHPRLVEIEAWTSGGVQPAPPEITVTSPSTGTLITEGEDVDFVFTAVPSTQTGGTLTKVELYRDATLVDDEDPATGTSFTLTDSAPDVGTYDYTIKAYHSDLIFSTKLIENISVIEESSTPVGAGNYAERVEYCRSRGYLVMAKPLARNTPEDLNLTGRKDNGAFCGVMSPGNAPNIVGQPVSLAQIYPGSTPAPYMGLPIIDTDIKPPGAEASLRFDVPAFGGANTSGDWYTHFGTDFSNYRLFGENSEFWVQIRVRWNQAMYNTNFQMTPASGGIDNPTGNKIMDYVGGDFNGIKVFSSGNGKLVTQTQDQHNFLIMYHWWQGNNGVGINSPIPGEPGNINVQPGSEYGACTYFAYNALDVPPPNKTKTVPAGCVPLQPDVWMTFTDRIRIMDLMVNEYPNRPIYRINMARWIQFESEPKILWMNVEFAHELDFSGHPQAPYDFGQIIIFPYMTNKSSTQPHPLAQAWYSELIVATGEIPEVSDNPSLASWRPAAGTVADVSLNKVTDCDDDAAYTSVPGGWTAGGVKGLVAWCSVAALDDYGELGGFATIGGGGHDDFYGVGFGMWYDAASRLWTRKGNPKPIMVGAANVGDRQAYNIAHCALPEGHYVGTGISGMEDIPVAGHTYNACQAWPTEWGGGPEGSAILIGNGSVNFGGQLGYYGIYSQSGETGEFDHLGTLSAPGGYLVNGNNHGGYGQKGVWFDSNRGLYWEWRDSDHTLFSFNPRTRTETGYFLGNVGAGGSVFWIYSIPFFCPTLDRLVYIVIDANFLNEADPARYKIYTCDPANPTAAGWRLNSFTGFQDGDIKPLMSATWCDDPQMDKATLYYGGNQFLTHLTPPVADGGTWTFSRESISEAVPGVGIRRPKDYPGAAPDDPQPDGTFNRFAWFKKIRAYLWWPHPDLPVQCISPGNIN